MKRCSLYCAGPWPFIILPLLLLGPLLFFKWHAIEEDVARNAKADLSSIGSNWANIETTNRGRNVLLTGTPPNEAAIKTARETVENSYGVDEVEVSSDAIPAIIPPSSPELNAIITGESVVLRGTLANQENIDATVSKAKKAFGQNHVTNKLQIGDNTAALPKLDGFFLALVDKSFELETLKASLKGDSLTLAGTVNSEQSNSMLAAQMAKSVGLNITNNLTVPAPSVPAPSVPAPSVVTPIEVPIDCQILVNELLSNGKIGFQTGKATIQKESFILLADIKSAVSQCTDTRFEVSGHTDSTGSLSLNMTLSEQRAQAVVDHLVGLGLEASRLTSTGYGPNKPIADNTTPVGRAQNRRIEFKITN